MACITDLKLDSVSLDCNDIPVGGINEIYISNYCDAAVAVVDKPLKGDGSPNAAFGKATAIGFREDPVNSGKGKVYKIEFNKRDGVTNFTDAKTVDPSGLITVVPTLTIELPKATAEKMALGNAMANPSATFKFFIGTAAGTKHVLGAKFGMTMSEVSMQSGTGRTDKNTVTYTFIGEESELAYDASETWGNVIGKILVTDSSASNNDWQADMATNESYVGKQACLPK